VKMGRGKVKKTLVYEASTESSGVGSKGWGFDKKTLDLQGNPSVLKKRGRGEGRGGSNNRKSELAKRRGRKGRTEEKTKKHPESGDWRIGGRKKQKRHCPRDIFGGPTDGKH